MGLRINSDLETSAGPTMEAYARIDNYRVDKVSSKISFAVSYWLNKEAGQKFNRTYLGDNLKSATGLFSSKVVCYDVDDEGVEVELPTFLSTNNIRVEEVEDPIFETVTETKVVPYVSFDEEGNEITLEREVSHQVEKQVGSNKTVKKLIDTSVYDNITGFCYNHLKGELAKLFNDITIEDV